MNTSVLELAEKIARNKANKARRELEDRRILERRWTASEYKVTELTSVEKETGVITPRPYKKKAVVEDDNRIRTKSAGRPYVAWKDYSVEELKQMLAEVQESYKEDLERERAERKAKLYEGLTPDKAEKKRIMLEKQRIRSAERYKRVKREPVKTSAAVKHRYYVRHAEKMNLIARLKQALRTKKNINQ